LEIIEALLARGETFAFVGKPCDVSALRRLARIDPRVDRCLVLAASFFCAGVPSERGADRILAAMDVPRAELAAFRYRGEGWPGQAAATTRDGRVVEMSYEESWGGHLSKEVQFRCKICPDAVGGVADIACGDAWYGDDRGYPSFEERDGRSLVVARTALGESFLGDAIAAGAVVCEPLGIEEIDRMQPSQARRKRLVLARSAALVATLRSGLDMKGTRVKAAARRASLGEQVYNFLGMVRRVTVGRT
jgi:coenzyme F420 hydrogenase subunit beta